MVKEGISGDGYSVRGIYTDYKLAVERCEDLIENHDIKFCYEDLDYWSGTGFNSAHYICIRKYDLNFPLD
jgi:hypothetical protein